MMPEARQWGASGWGGNAEAYLRSPVARRSAIRRHPDGGSAAGDPPSCVYSLLAASFRS